MLPQSANVIQKGPMKGLLENHVADVRLLVSNKTDSKSYLNSSCLPEINPDAGSLEHSPTL